MEILRHVTERLSNEIIVSMKSNGSLHETTASALDSASGSALSSEDPYARTQSKRKIVKTTAVPSLSRIHSSSLKDRGQSIVGNGS